MPRTFSPQMDFVCRAAGLDKATFEQWRQAGFILRDVVANQGITRLDVMTAAILAEFSRHGIDHTALGIISARIYDGAEIVTRHGIAIASLPTILYHGALRLAEEDGRFSEFTKSDGVDPSSRLFSSYGDYLAWCRNCATAPSDEEEALLAILKPDDLALLPFCHDLLSEEAPSGWSVIWDLILLDETPLLYSRRSNDPPPRDIMDGEEAASWLSLSITGIDRQIARRVALAA